MLGISRFALLEKKHKMYILETLIAIYKIAKTRVAIYNIAKLNSN